MLLSLVDEEGWGAATTLSGFKVDRRFVAQWWKEPESFCYLVALVPLVKDSFSDERYEVLYQFML